MRHEAALRLEAACAYDGAKILRLVRLEPTVETSIELIRRARNGDPVALDALAARLLPRLRRWATGRLPRYARGVVDTDDIVQDALMNTLRRMDAFEPRHEGALQAYVRQAVQNRIREEIRRVPRRPAGELPTDVPAGGPSPLDEAVGREDLDRYEAALAKLRDEDREAIVLRLELGYDYLDLAAALEKPSPDAARMAVCRAIRRLAEEIGRGA